MAEQYIFTIEDLTKAYGKREVLKNIWLAFYPGTRSASSAATAPARARCCASWPWRTRTSSAPPGSRPASRIGYVPQEPRLDETKDVRGNIEEAVAAHPGPAQPARGTRQQDWPSRSTPTRWTSCMDETGQASRTRSTPPTPGSWIASSKSPWTPCVCRPATPRPTTLSGGERRRVALCKIAAAKARPAAARRADQPPRRRVGRLARTASCRNIPAPSSPSRTIATSSTTWPSGSWSWIAARASRGRAITPPGWSRRRHGWTRRRSRNRPAARPWNANWNGPAWPRGPASPRARPA